MDNGHTPESLFDERKEKTMKHLVIAMLLFPAVAVAADCGCGPDFCLDSAEYKAALAKKKAAAQKNGAPARLIALYDKLDHCTASIEQSPDSFNILRHGADGSIQIDSWEAANEKASAAAVKAGALKACHVLISRKSFACCGAPKPEQRPDYDAALDMNKSATLACQ